METYYNYMSVEEAMEIIERFKYFPYLTNITFIKSGDNIVMEIVKS